MKKTASHLILLVDDYADNRAMYARYLAHVGFRVDEAVNQTRITTTNVDHTRVV